MAAKHHMPREELKRDEVAETLTSLVDDFNRHRTAILATIGIVVLAIGFWVTLSRRSEAAAIENAEIFGSAHQLIANARFMEDEEQRQIDLKKAIDSLQTLVDKRGASPAGLHAILLQGNAYLTMDAFGDAAGAYESYIRKAGTPEATAKGAIALGQTYESQSFLEEDSQQLSEALTQYERAAAAVPAASYLHAQALMNQGRVHELLGDTEQALAAYRAVVETRSAPREDIPGAEDETGLEIETGNPFMDNLFDEAVEGAGKMSFRAQAQQRIDRLEGGAGVGQATGGA